MPCARCQLKELKLHYDYQRTVMAIQGNVQLRARERRLRTQNARAKLRRRLRTLTYFYLVCGHGFCTVCAVTMANGVKSPDQGVVCSVCHRESNVVVPCQTGFNIVMARALVASQLSDDVRTNPRACPRSTNCPFRETLCVVSHSTQQRPGLHPSEARTARLRMEKHRLDRLQRRPQDVIIVKDFGYVRFEMFNPAGGLYLQRSVVKTAEFDNIVPAVQVSIHWDLLVQWYVTILDNPLSCLEYVHSSALYTADSSLTKALCWIGALFGARGYSRPTVEQLCEACEACGLKVTQHVLVVLLAANCIA